MIYHPDRNKVKPALLRSQTGEVSHINLQNIEILIRGGAPKHL